MSKEDFERTPNKKSGFFPKKLDQPEFVPNQNIIKKEPIGSHYDHSLDEPISILITPKTGGNGLLEKQPSLIRTINKPESDRPSWASEFDLPGDNGFWAGPAYRNRRGSK